MRKLATEKEIEVARANYQDDDCEIDDGAKVSEVPGEGRWVAAWVWVSDALMEAHEEKKETENDT